MMMSNSGYTIILKEAFKAFRKKRFSEAIILLEKITTQRIKEPYPHFLLCVSYLLCNKFGDADIMIKKIRAADPSYLPLKQLEVFLLLKSASTINELFTVCIEKLELYPKDKYFKRMLRYLHKVKDFSIFQKQAKLTDFVYIPKPKSVKISAGYNSAYIKPDSENRSCNRLRKSKFKKMTFIMLIIFILTGTAYYLYYINPQLLMPQSKEDKASLPIDNINIDILQYELIDKILKLKPPVFYYSNDELINDFHKAKNLIKSEKYNEALIIINKIANSNANYRVKERNEFLQKFISNIEFKKYDAIPVGEVLHKFYLYKGSFVRWDGKIANLITSDNKMQFNLLIEYKKEYKFSGVIDVYSGKVYKDIKNGDIVTLEGVIINTVGSNSRIYLAADKISKN
jgi:hypothetical protein